MSSKDFTFDEIKNCDEAFVTGTFAGIIPVSKIENRNLISTNSNSLTNHIRELYNKHLNNNIKNMIVACWSGPRNISTALMRSWSSREDTFITDEPFYSYYLNETKLKHPMYSEIISKYPTSYSEIVNYLINEIPENKKIWYQKHMAHHILDLKNIEWVANCKNCILLRHPKEVISSYCKK